MVWGRTNYDMDILRTFVLGVEQCSFARAAERVGRSASAVSLQLKKLEQQCGHALLARNGRGLELTEAGRAFLPFAQRILEANDQANHAMRALTPLSGRLAIGVPQDFAETWLPDLLARFSSLHPDVTVHVKVDRASVLLEEVERDGLDLALVWQTGEGAESEWIWRTPMLWLGHASMLERPLPDRIPYVGFEAPCVFRKAATEALDAAGYGWRQCVESPGLSGIWAALKAGLGITVRTRMGLPENLLVLPSAPEGLPLLGNVDLVLHQSGQADSPAVEMFCSLLAERLDLLMERAGD